ncbi:MAG: hypothetical protein M1819_001905 [Sarea resinae]|nr:MAG: hypothetical protein M1819_001905 [Sarea resinae]
MQCDICLRSQSSRLAFHCTTCARNALYELRVENARTLLEKEELGRQVESLVSAPTTSNDTTKEAETERAGPRRWAIEQAVYQKQDSLDRIREMKAQSELLQSEIETGKADISRRKALLAQRRSELTEAGRELPSRRATTLGTVKKSISRTEARWDALHSKTVESRAFLCREAANLYGFRQRRRKKSGTIKEDYVIGGVGIVDLRELNSASPTQITTSITNLSHLLILASHYLLLRLPAEITLPHRGYPLPTIFPPSSSYLNRDVPFPGSTTAMQATTNPSEPRTDLRPMPRPRPLYIEKPLPVLAKEDPLAYSLFIEGVTLLAWDIAWLCKTQGLNTSLNTWEDVCPLGRNLWQLLVAPPPPPPPPAPTPTPQSQPQPQRNLSAPQPTSSRNATAANPARSPSPLAPNTAAISTPKGPTPQPNPRPTPTLGMYSHGTAHTFLSAHQGTDYMRSWKLQSPMRIVDRVKGALLGELAGAEWEVLDEREWEDAAGGGGGGVGFGGDGIGGEDDEAVLVGGRRRKGAAGGGNGTGTGSGGDGDVREPTKGADVPRVKSPASINTNATTISTAAAVATTEDGEATDRERDGTRTRGTSGWTKLKSR